VSWAEFTTRDDEALIAGLRAGKGFCSCTAGLASASTTCAISPRNSRKKTTSRGRGADVDPEVQRMGAPVPPMFAVRDPDGNELAIVEPLED
jgi:hypothetical protein